MSVQFGTDGIRGRAGTEITTDVAYRLGRAVASVFSATTFVGYDTRESSPELARAVLNGARDGGVEAVNLGVFTTPGVAVIAEERRGVGVVVSASHNPYTDNGLKVFGLGGSKLDYDTEHAVAAALRDAAPLTRSLEDIAIDESAADHYLERLRGRLSNNALEGLHVVLDCANGAASSLAPRFFRSLGAKVDVLHADPNGRNINEGCGSTDPTDLAAAVVAHGADLGLAFDGDADRLVAIDESGRRRDGDDLMVLFALDLHQQGLLGNSLVVTSMSNLGLRQALAAAGIDIVETDVGDRNVLVALEERDLPFGGEQSGHLIFRRELSTGDGMLSARHLCELVARSGSLGALATRAWSRAPQVLINIARDDYRDDSTRSDIAAVLAAHGVSEREIRLVIRPSGTEPLVRVMVEATDATLVDAIAEAVRQRYGMSTPQH
ncbi:MAG: phosphoglucosamine mutase [Acidobacteria bacterium]|nr:phosphoglucosamine mutase [Acidobacteriota bacterium]